MARVDRAVIDFESRSRIELRKSGAWRYWQDDSTQISCLAFRLPTMKPGEVDHWLPDWVCDILGIAHMPPPPRLIQWIEDGGIVEAHNAMFERAGWRCKLVGEHFWPDIPDEQWRCSAAKAASYSLPRALEKCCQIMRLDVQKDKEGHALMMKMCKPRKATKKVPETWVQDPESLLRQLAYCKQDVLAEERFSESLPDLNPVEQEIWLIDQEINERGLPVDLPLVNKAIDTLAILKEKYEQEIVRLTNGRVDRVTKRAALKEWMWDNGFEIPDTKATTLDDLLTDQFLPDHIHGVVSRVRMAGRASTAKYKTIAYRASADSRCRDILVYAGASRTSRWCLTGDHEVLTPGGWRRLDMWTGGDIAVWSEGEFEFKHSRQLSFDYDGSLCVLNNARFSQISTPEHSMPVRWKNDPVAKTPVKNLKRGHRIIREGLRQSKGTFWSDDLVRLIIMAQADGHYTEDGALRWHFKKERKVQRCKFLLEINRIYYNTSRNGDGTTTINIPKTRLSNALRMLLPGKTFCWSMLDCNPEVFFEELVQWDGGQVGPDSCQYSTTNGSNADFVQALAHLSRRSCNITEQKKPTGKEHWNTNYYCNIWGKCPDFEFRPQHLSYDTMIGGKVYCAETPTGYFLVRRNNCVWITGNSGAGIQPQNLPRGKIKDMDATVLRLMELDAEELEEEYEDLYSVFSGALRGAIIPGAGKKLVTADYSAVEARGLFWVCDHQEGVEMFLKGIDPYLEMACFINNLDYLKIKGEFDEAKKAKAHTIPWADERQFGKQIILGAGYQLGPPKFIDYCAQSKIVIDLDTAKKGIHGYRERHAPVPQFWYACEAAAVEAMQRPGVVVRVNRHIAYKRANRFLFCQLPSGRLIPYPYPKLEWNTREWLDEKTGKWVETKKLAISYEEVNSFTKKWDRSWTYGGKLCLAADTEVLSERGWISIIEVKLTDRLWDGVEWVNHDGLVCNGKSDTLNVSGVRMTADHEVMAEKGWICASQSEGLNWHQVELPDGDDLCWIRWEEVSLDNPLRLWKRVRNAWSRVSKGQAEVLWMPKRQSDSSVQNNTWNVSSSSVCSMEINDRQVLTANPSSVGELWRAWHSRLSEMAGQFRSLLVGHGANLSIRAHLGSSEQREGLQFRELPLGDIQGTGQQSASAAFQVSEGRRQETVYDITNCGPRNRFVVRGRLGHFVVHNCENIVQALCRDIMAHAMRVVKKDGRFQILLTVHDELVTAIDILKVAALGGDKEAYKLLEQLMCVLAPWAAGFPIAAEGKTTSRYSK